MSGNGWPLPTELASVVQPPPRNNPPPILLSYCCTAHTLRALGVSTLGLSPFSWRVFRMTALVGGLKGGLRLQGS
jgi:hypothetical protein